MCWSRLTSSSVSRYDSIYFHLFFNLSVESTCNVNKQHLCNMIIEKKWKWKPLRQLFVPLTEWWSFSKGLNGLDETTQCFHAFKPHDEKLMTLKEVTQTLSLIDPRVIVPPTLSGTDASVTIQLAAIRSTSDLWAHTGQQHCHLDRSTQENVKICATSWRSGSHRSREEVTLRSR